MVWLVSVDNDRWRQVASLIRKPFDHKCCFPSCHLHHLHIIFSSSSSSSSSYYHHPHHHQYGSSSVVSKLGPGHLLTTIVVQFNTDPGHLLPSGTWFDLPLDVFALSEIWFMKEEELQVWMIWDLSAVGEEWAEAPEWLPHFVTDHTDRLHCCCWCCCWCWCSDKHRPLSASVLNVFQAFAFKMSSKLQGWDVTVWLTTSVWTCQTEWG